MTDTLREGEFDLDGMAFGGEDHDIVVLPRGFRPGGYTVSTQDQASPTGDYRNMGRDTLDAAIWSWDLATNGEDAADATSTLDGFAAAWSNKVRRSQAGAISTLRYRIGGRTRRVYGRARRFTPVVTQVLWVGVAGGIAEFQPVEPITYDDEKRSLTISSVPPSAGGLVAPFVAPFTTSQSTTRDGHIADVGGLVETPPVITIHGPINRPFVAGPDWRLDLDTDIPAGGSVIIDTHPATQTVARGDGASVAGALSLGSRLSRVRLHPGSSLITFGGTDPTGSAYCTVDWHPAYPSF